MNRIETLAKLRILTAFLGESDQFGWWPTSFLSPTGRRYLEFNFPRTVTSAGVYSISQAAKELHDQRIGRRGVFHLFRLPHAIEQDIHALLATEAERQFASLIQSQDQAIKELEEMAEGQDMSAEGPVRISGIAQLTHKNSLRKVAACYCQAFKGDQQTYPYFTVE